jgi:hypothetical protein
MSATGETPFFDGDGTHAPVPQDSFADPLSGTVTTSDGDESVVEEFERLRIADPVQPDPDTVREMVNATMLAENSDYDRPLRSVPNAPQVSGSSPHPAGQPPLGVIPQQRTWPVRAPQILRQARRPKQRVSEEDVDEVRPARQQRPRRRLRATKPSSNSAGVIIAIVLMIVFAVVAIQLLASLFSSIAGLFA